MRARNNVGENQMRTLILTAALSATMIFSAQAGPGDCSATASERNAFIGAAMLNALDRGRDTAGALSGGADYFLRDPEIHGDALTRYCASNPNASLASAMETLFPPSVLTNAAR